MRVSRVAFPAPALAVLLLMVLMAPAARARAREGRDHTQRRPCRRAAGAAFSPDGTRILSADRNSTVKLWEVVTGRVLQSFEGEREYSPVLVFSPDGAQAVSLRSNILTLWNLATGEPIRSINELPSRTTSVAFAPDGKSVVVGAINGIAQLRDVESGRIPQVFRHIPAKARGDIAVAVTPDGALVLTAGGRGSDKAAGDMQVKVWEATTGRLVRAFGDLGRYSDRVRLDVSPEGARVAVGDDNASAVQIWDIATGTLLKTLLGRAPPGGGISDWRAMQVVAFSRDGALVTSGGIGWVRAWDANTGELVYAFGEETSHRAEHGYFYAVSPDGTLAVSGGLTLTLWDVTKGQPVRDYVGLAHPVGAASLDGERLLSVGLGGTLSLWDVASGMPVRQGRLEDGFRSVREVWDVRTPRRLRDFGTSADEKRVRRSFEDTDAITAVAFSPDGGRILSAGHDGTRMKLWDVATGQLTRTWEGQPGVRSLAFSPDGGQVLSGGGDTKFQLWDVATGRLLQTFLGHAADITSMALSRDGRRVFSGCRDGTVGIWDRESGARLAMMIRREGGAWLTVTPEGFFAASTPVAAVGVLSVARGFGVFGIDPFVQILYRPDLVRETLAGDRDGKVKTAAAALDLEKVLDSGAVPNSGDPRSAAGRTHVGAGAADGAFEQHRGAGVLAGRQPRRIGQQR